MKNRKVTIAILCAAVLAFAGASYVTAQMYHDNAAPPDRPQANRPGGPDMRNNQRPGNMPCMQQQGGPGMQFCQMQGGQMPGGQRQFMQAGPDNRNMPQGPQGQGKPGNDMRGGQQRPFDQEHIEHAQMMLGLVHQMEIVCFRPESAGMVAVGSIKDDVQRKPEEVAKDLEELLKNTKSIGLRNAIRITLKDIYRMTKQDDKVLEHMRAMLAENDKAAMENAPEKK